MGYTHTTLLAAKAQLAARLHDSNKVFWTDTELGLYLVEALRMWNALSGFHRSRQTLATAAGTAFYYLPAGLSAELGYTVTDRDLINIIQAHFLEPLTTSWAGGWTGTEMFTMDEVQKSIQRRRDQFLADTGMVITRSSMGVPLPAGGRLTVPDSVIDVRRIMWTTPAGVKTHLWRSDEMDLNSYSRTWAIDPATPWAYSVMSAPPLTIQLAPVPGDAGTLELLSVNAGAACDYAAGVILGIPDDWAWAVKWGAMAALLGKDGPAFDPTRAKFCESRYTFGVTLAREAPCVYQSQLNGINLAPVSLAEMDAYDPDWQNNSTSTPEDICLAGHNLIALNPIPDGVYSITLDVARKFPVPALDSSYLEIGREQLDAIIDYAEHLAMFKTGGAEFMETSRQAEAFLSQAVAFNSRLSAAAKSLDVAEDQSGRESRLRPRTQEVASA